VPEVDVGRRRVEAELDAQRPSLRELARERPLGEAVDGIAGEEGGFACRGSRHGANARVRRARGVVCRLSCPRCPGYVVRMEAAVTGLAT
jgi:hypothetical protein